MSNINLKKPVLICVYGFPGSGKTYLAGNLARDLDIAHVSIDRIRAEFFGGGSGDREITAANRLAIFMAKEFLTAGMSVAYDGDVLTIKQRQSLKVLATRLKATYLLVWLQVDAESAFARASSRDKRTFEGKHSLDRTRTNFNDYLESMEHPQNEDYLVVSGKHNFASQKSAIISRLYQGGIVDSSALTGNVIKPELVNLVPNINFPMSGPEHFGQN